MQDKSEPRSRYRLHDVIATGATATVHLAQRVGDHGFAKIVAIKRLHPHHAASAEMRALLVEEGKLVSRIAHPNVAQVLDVVEDDGEVLLVMEYVQGETLERLASSGEQPAPEIAVAVARDLLHGLHAAYHARGADGTPLCLVHRDMSPRNVMVGADGRAKVLDFGIAKARGRNRITRDGHVRGTLAYMAPEQLHDEPLTLRTDVYGVAVVLWETLTAQRLFDGENAATVIKRVLDHDVTAPSKIVPSLPRALDGVVLRGLASEPGERFATALDMAVALESALTPASSDEVGRWVRTAAVETLACRERLIAAIESSDDNVAALVAGTKAAPADGGEAPGAPPKAKPRWQKRAALLSAVPLMAAVVVFGLVARRPDRSAMPDGSSRVGAAAPAAVAEPSSAPNGASAVGSASSSRAASPVELSPSPVAPAAPSAASSGGALSLAPLSGRPPRSVPSATPGSAEAGATPTATVAATCAPYFLDSAGHRRFNRDCLR